MSKWSKEDSAVWNNSEVMREFEAKITKAAKYLDNISNIKNAQLAQSKLESTKKTVSEIKKEVGEISNSIENLSDDGESEQNQMSLTEMLESEYTEDKSSDLIDELRSMARDAIDSGNIKLAYEIERTIDKLIEE